MKAKYFVGQIWERNGFMRKIIKMDKWSISFEEEHVTKGGKTEKTIGRNAFGGWVIKGAILLNKDEL